MSDKIRKIIEIVITCLVALLLTLVLSVAGISLWFDATFTYDIKIVLAITFISLLVFVGVIFIGRVMFILRKMEAPEGFADRVQRIKSQQLTTTYHKNEQPTPTTPATEGEPVIVAEFVEEQAAKEVPPAPKRKYKPVFGPGADNNYKVK